jgi:aminoglycoside phosphotransferase (APT) family kinase protein
MSTTQEFQAQLESFLAEATGSRVRVTAARQLTGGASRDTWAIEVEVATGAEAGKQSLVLRRDMGGNIQDEALTREQEFRMLQAAYAAGVLVPRPRWLCIDQEVLGVPFFIMDRLQGESVGRRIVRDPVLEIARTRLPAQMAQQLALIHGIDAGAAKLDFLPGVEAGLSPAKTALRRTTAQLWALDEPHPALELASRWLEARAPACEQPLLLHGDFRIGNLMVGQDGLRGVFDWEFAHIGDPHADLAWPCVRSWRFGNDQMRMGGIAPPEAFFEAYEIAAERGIDRKAIAYWEVLGNFRWAVGCMAQANRHLSGQARSIELASLGRRTAEMELEVLDLIERWEAAT